MVRPALSAARGFDIIDLLAASPDRGFTLSEIARAAQINVASCHAVLNVLADRGYLVRDPQSRSFSLGPMLYAAGHAALQRQPLLEQSRAAAERIVRELDIPIAISTVIGEHIVGIVAIANSGGASTGLRVGERRPLIPPIGTPFVAWSGDDAIAQWLDRAPGDDPAWQDALRSGIATIRARGFEVLLRTTDSTSLASELNVLAGNHFHRLGPDMSLPETIEADCSYDVTMIAAPIFDRSGACVFNMCLGPFPRMLTGAEVLDYADQLLRVCVAVMHADRSQG
jgi:DNA-binding IclR family transcriptional regulator